VTAELAARTAELAALLPPASALQQERLRILAHSPFAAEGVETIEQAKAVAARAAALLRGDHLFVSPAVWQGKEPPARNWLVQDAFLAANVALLAGDGGVGKSLLMLQLAACAAAGQDWLGLPTKRGRSILLAAEDDLNELWRRSADVCRALETELSDFGESALLMPLTGQDARLIAFERYTGEAQPTTLWEKLEMQVGHFGASYVVIDTATATFGGNQNNESQVFAYVAQLRRLAMRTGCAVILTKHPSVAGRSNGSGESGSVAWSNSVRARLFFTRDRNGRRVLKTLKSNYGTGREEIPLRYERGVFVVDRPEGWRPYAD
jgi:RecA-family ATPase